MAKTKIGSNATFSGTQKGLTIIGEHCYAYSGKISVANTAIDLLEFNSGKGYIVCQVQMGYGQISGTDDYEYEITFNGIEVFAYVVNHSLSDIGSEPDNFMNILIPPLTKVTIRARNRSDSDSNPQYAMLVGRIYDA